MPYGLLTAAFLGCTAAQAADNGSISMGATVLSKNQCKFSVASAALSFGTIHAASDSDATAVTTLQFRCVGSDAMASYSITQNGGLHKTASSTNRLRHATLAEYLPYQLTISPGSGNALKGETYTVTISGRIRPVHFQNAHAGNYSDTVVISIKP